MGTLFNQSIRQAHSISQIELERRVDVYESIIKKRDITMSELIELNKALEMERANDLRVNDGDAKDEQLAGFGELMQEFIFIFRQAFGKD
jgi:hypothetical protein